MKLKKNIFKLVLIVGLISQSEFLAKNQNNLNLYEVSILTIGEGESLVDAFGHTAIRVKDSKLKNNLIY